MIDRIAADEAFPLTKEEILKGLDPNLFVGRSVSQTEEFIANVVKPILSRQYKEEIVSELKV